MKDIEQIIRAVKTKHPAVSVHQLRVPQPGADDDGLWFFGADDSEVEVQIESSTGMCPFLVETSENAERLGKILLNELKSIRHKKIKTVRGRGLFCAMVIDDSSGKNAWDLCLALKENGLLAKPTHGDIIRFAPPLVITEEQLKECIGIIKSTLEKF